MTFIASVHVMEKQKLENAVDEEQLKALQEEYESQKLAEDENNWVKSVLFNEERDPEKTIHPCNALYNSIFQRRSIRKFTEEEVPENHLQLMIESARYAPSSCNRQPCAFTITGKTEMLAELCSQKFIAGAKKAIIVVVNMDCYGSMKNKNKRYFSLLDAGAAIQNMLLAADNLNVGCCWINTAGKVSRRIHEAFSLPGKHAVVSVIAMGIPDHEPKPPGRKPVKIWQR
jgi:nitroreductase